MTKAKLPKLDCRSARVDFTDRECTKILGGVIGALLQSAPPDTVKRALRWWAEFPEVHPGAWEGIVNVNIGLALGGPQVRAGDDNVGN